MRVATIDFGSNTFSCLIAEVGDEWKYITNRRYFVHLGSEVTYISNDAKLRAFAAIDELRTICTAYKVEQVLGIATEAIRKATNGTAFLNEIFARFPMQIKLVDGYTEGWLISLAVQKAIPTVAENTLIVDVGGGSVEFISLVQNQVHQVFSFPIGILNLKKLFKKTDPLSAFEHQFLTNYLQQTLQPLAEYLVQHPIQNMIGVSGVFDVFATILVGQGAAKKVSYLDLTSIKQLMDAIIFKSEDELIAMKNIPANRIPFMAVATAIVQYLIVNIGIQNVAVSPFSLKEGTMQTFVHKKDIPAILTIG